MPVQSLFLLCSQFPFVQVKGTIKNQLLQYFYSYLNASIGFNKEALYAGQQPKSTPIKPEKPNDKNIENIETEDIVDNEKDLIIISDYGEIYMKLL